MQMRRMRNKGFTLTEIIVVLVILAILAAAVIPTAIGYLDHVQAQRCQINRDVIARNIKAVMLEDDAIATMDSSAVLPYMQEKYDLDWDPCAKGGAYRVYYLKNTDQLLVECSKHASAVSGHVVSDLIKDIRSQIEGIYVGGRELQEKLKEAYGGQFPAVTLNGTSYYLKVDSYQGNREERLVYASENDKVGNWNARYIYDHTSDTWYKYYNAEKPKQEFMMAGKPLNTILESINASVAAGDGVWTATTDMP